jgi:dTDP-4-amino-4,6-dideoxygalactose transaminase
MINVFQPVISESDIASVSNTLKSGWLGKGSRVQQFEQDFAEYIGINPNCVVSINSCTEALFLAIEMLDIAPGEEVIIPSIHFIGASQAVLSKGAIPVFCDVDSRTLNTTLDFIEAKFTIGKTAAVILLHYGGVPCQDTIKIKAWCDQLGIFLIEDSACSLGATLNGQHCGTMGDIGVWSFDAMKLITTGDGGMMYFVNEDMAQEARLKTYLGMSHQSGLTSDKAKWWEFEVSQFGARRSIMNDIAASLGIEQLKRIGIFIARRGSIYWTYEQLIDDVVKTPGATGHTGKWTSNYFYWIQTPLRDDLAQFLRQQGIYCTFRYYPLHRAYKTGNSLPGAEKAANETLLLPLHCGLSDSDVEYVCEKVREFYV